MKFFPSLAVWLFVLGAPAVHGQFYNYYQPSTAGESYANGAANVIQARGNATLSASQAAINAEDAYSKAIDNSVKSVNAYWQNKDTYAQRQAQKNYETAQRRSDYMAKHGLQSLTPQDFDRTTGQVAWPRQLEQPQYDAFRSQYDEFFRKRASEGALGSDDYMAIMAASQQWRALLTSQQSQYPPEILSQMIRFVLKLDREMKENLG